MRWLIVVLLCLCGCGSSARKERPPESARLEHETVPTAALLASSKPDKIDKDGVPVYYRDSAAPVGVIYRKKSMDDGHGC